MDGIERTLHIMTMPYMLGHIGTEWEESFTEWLINEAWDEDEVVARHESQLEKANALIEKHRPTLTSRTRMMRYPGKDPPKPA